jgi:hypothetical protein
MLDPYCMQIRIHNPDKISLSLAKIFFLSPSGVDFPFNFEAYYVLNETPLESKLR